MLKKGLIILLFLNHSAYALDAYEKEQVIKRIKPVGQVRVEGDEKKQQLAAVAEPAAKTDADAGEATYKQYCTVCHQTGVAGAPKFRNAADWKPRTDAKSLDELVASSIKGLNAMPPKGTCMSCSEEDIKQAIEYMLPHDN